MTDSVDQRKQSLEGLARLRARESKTEARQVDAAPLPLADAPLGTADAREVLSRSYSAAKTPPPSAPPSGGGGAKTGSADPTKEGLVPPEGGASGAAPAGALLGNTRITSQHTLGDPQLEDESAGQTRRGDRYLSRWALRGITSLERVAKCGVASRDEQGAAVVMNASVAHWSGLCTCGSIWACPVCSAKIRATRADEIARVVAKHIVSGGNAWMVSLTARHKIWHALEDVLDAVAKGWPKLMGGAAWRGLPATGRRKTPVMGEKEALGVVGWIRSLEITYGDRNGWHPHLHVVLLTRDEMPADLMKAMGRWDRTWRKWMAKHGFEPSTEHGVVWSHVSAGKDAGEYIAKVQEGHLGNEIARGDLKRGRFKTLAPFELLRYFRITGDAAVIPIWHEYEKGTHGRKAITWAQGLRKLYLEDEPEKTNEEIAAEEIGGETMVIIRAESMKRVHDTPGLDARILSMAERGGFTGLVQLLTEMHIEYEVPIDETERNETE